jgi:hypothetical protein
VFVILHDDLTTVDGGYDTSLTATNLLSDATDYASYRRIGAVLLDATENIIAYMQAGDTFIWLPARQDISITNPGTSEVAHTLASVPADIRTQANVSIIFGRPNSVATFSYFTAGGGDNTLGVPSTTNADAITYGDGRFATVHASLLTNTSRQIKTRSSETDSNLLVKIQTHGWTDFRGKE